MYDPKDRKYFSRLVRLRFLSRVVLMAERVTESFLPTAIWICFFAALWLLAIPSIFGTAGSLFTSITFISGLIWLFWQGIQRFKAPGTQETERRMETDSGLHHRPVTQRNDTLFNDTHSNARLVWAKRRAKIIDGLKKLRPAKPRPVSTQKDPYALRIGVLTLLVVGFVFAGSSWQDRLRGGMFPFTVSAPEGWKTRLVVTLTPPEYTGQGKIVFKGTGKSEETLKVPDGSQIEIRAQGGLGTPELFFGDQQAMLDNIENKLFVYEGPLPNQGSIKVRQLALTKFYAPYSLTPDTPPELSTNGEHEVLHQGELRFPLKLQDDYGVRTLSMTLTLDPAIEDAPLGKPEHETRAAMTAAGQEAELEPVYNFTSHPWAGLPVIVTFTASDAKEQNSEAVTFSLALPERDFAHPVAVKLIEQRKKLAWTPEGLEQEIAKELEQLLRHPEDFQHETVVQLGLVTSAYRLLRSPGIPTAEALLDVFWQMAVHLDDGDLDLATERLRDAQRTLEQALNNPDTSDEEIARLTEDLRQAMAEYFQELQRAIQKRMAEGQDNPQIPAEMLGDAIDPQAFMDFFSQMESQALSGDRDQALDMLSKLNQLMDMLDPSINAPLPPDMQMMAEGVNELQELIRKQEELLDTTRDLADKTQESQTYGETLPQDGTQSQNMPPQPQGPAKPSQRSSDTQEQSANQEVLRYILGELMREAGEILPDIPEGMGKAEQEMRQSSSQLKANNPEGSIPHQEAALKYLRESMNQMSQQMAQRLQQMFSFSMGQRRDPLGRRQEGGKNPFDQNRVKIPDEAERKRLEAIQRTLRERSGELDREEQDLDYFRRLLKQF